MLALVWLVVVIEQASRVLPFSGMLGSVFVFVLGLWLAVMWFLRAAVLIGFSLGRVDEGRRVPSKRTMVAQAMIPCIGMLGIALAVTDVASRARFEFSRSSLERAAAGVRAGKEIDGPEIVGLYLVDSARLGREGAVRFVTDWDMIDPAGLYYAPDADMAALAPEYETVERLSGPWYRFIGH